MPTRSSSRHTNRRESRDGEPLPKRSRHSNRRVSRDGVPMRRRTGRRGSQSGIRERVAGPDIDTPLKDDDGLSALEIFLRDYDRITSNDVCDVEVQHINVWVYDDSHWTQWSEKKADKFLQRDLRTDQSVCKTLLTNIFKMNDVQYTTMKNHFLSPTSRDVAGLYKRRGGEGDFAIVVRLPVDVPHGSNVGHVLGGLLTSAVGATALTGAALGAAAYNRRYSE